MQHCNGIDLGALGVIGCGFILLVGCRAPTKPQPVAADTASSATNLVQQAPARAASFPPPQQDFPADRLHEHVDGAAPALVARGCRRLLFWQLTKPDVELEILVFNAESGARAELDKDTGNARTPSVPGEEGWTNQQVVYFRRGKAYCRLIASMPAPVAGLLEHAQRVDQALLSAEIRL